MAKDKDDDDDDMIMLMMTMVMTAAANASRGTSLLSASCSPLPQGFSDHRRVTLGGGGAGEQVWRRSQSKSELSQDQSRLPSPAGTGVQIPVNQECAIGDCLIHSPVCVCVHACVFLIHR